MDELIFAGNKYISSKRASKLTGYTTDYIGQMCRGDKMDCRLVGRNWYINEIAVKEHRKNYKKEQIGSKEEISYKKIDLEPMYYSNDDRDVTPNIDKSFSYEEESELKEITENTENQEVIPIKIIKRSDITPRAYQDRAIAQRPAREVVRRTPMLPQRTGLRIPFKGLVVASVLLAGILFATGSVVLEQVLHYASSDRSTDTTFQVAGVKNIIKHSISRLNEI